MIFLLQRVNNDEWVEVNLNELLTAAMNDEINDVDMVITIRNQQLNFRSLKAASEEQYGQLLNYLNQINCSQFTSLPEALASLLGSLTPFEKSFTSDQVLEAGDPVKLLQNGKIAPLNRADLDQVASFEINNPCLSNIGQVEQAILNNKRMVIHACDELPNALKINMYDNQNVRISGSTYALPYKLGNFKLIADSSAFRLFGFVKDNNGVNKIHCITFNASGAVVKNEAISTIASASPISVCKLDSTTLVICFAGLDGKGYYYTYHTQAYPLVSNTSIVGFNPYFGKLNEACIDLKAVQLRPDHIFQFRKTSAHFTNKGVQMEVVKVDVGQNGQVLITKGYNSTYVDRMPMDVAFTDEGNITIVDQEQDQSLKIKKIHIDYSQGILAAFTQFNNLVTIDAKAHTGRILSIRSNLFVLCSTVTGLHLHCLSLSEQNFAYTITNKTVKRASLVYNFITETLEVALINSDNLSTIFVNNWTGYFERLDNDRLKFKGDRKGNDLKHFIGVVKGKSGNNYQVVLKGGRFANTQLAVSPGSLYTAQFGSSEETANVENAFCVALSDHEIQLFN